MMDFNDSSVNKFFDTCRTVLGSGPGANLKKQFQNAKQSRASKRVIYRSFEKFKSDVDKKNIENDIGIVIYNPEPEFEDTPAKEKRSPVLYGRKFSELAKASGYVSMAAPSCRLAYKGKDVKKRFSICSSQLLAPMAKDFDFIDIQAQSVQFDPELYKSIVVGAASEIKKSNPNIKVVAQISTASSIKGDSAAMATSAHNVKDVVDGYWFNIENTPIGLDKAKTFIQTEWKIINDRAQVLH